MGLVPDQEQWAAWCAENAARLLLYARQQTRSEADAFDVVQDALLRMWHAAGEDPRLDLPSLPFAFTCIRRCAIDLGRKTDRRSRREEAAAAEAPQVSWFTPDLEQREQTAELEAALRRLPAHHQEILILKIWGDLTFQAIADMKKLSINTVASRYRYALTALRKTFAASGEPAETP